MIRAVTESEKYMLNIEASAPDEIVTVADSETLIVAAVADMIQVQPATHILQFFAGTSFHLTHE